MEESLIHPLTQLIRHLENSINAPEQDNSNYRPMLLMLSWKKIWGGEGENLMKWMNVYLFNLLLLITNII